MLGNAIGNSLIAQSKWDAYVYQSMVDPATSDLPNVQGAGAPHPRGAGLGGREADLFQRDPKQTGLPEPTAPQGRPYGVFPPGATAPPLKADSQAADADRKAINAKAEVKAAVVEAEAQGSVHISDTNALFRNLTSYFAGKPAAVPTEQQLQMTHFGSYDATPDGGPWKIVWDAVTQEIPFLKDSQNQLFRRADFIDAQIPADEYNSIWAIYFREQANDVRNLANQTPTTRLDVGVDVGTTILGSIRPFKVLGSIFRRANEVERVAADAAHLAELSSNGVKFTAEEVLATGRNSAGQVIFLESGNAKAGLKHIVDTHGSDFANIGVKEAEIPNVVMQAVTEGKLVGYQGTGIGRPIYEITLNGQTQRIAVTTSKNGFIVGANPAGSAK